MKNVLYGQKAPLETKQVKNQACSPIVVAELRLYEGISQLLT